MTVTSAAWACPACGNPSHRPAFRASTAVGRSVTAGDLDPAATAFGTTIGTVVRCTECSHAAVRDAPAPEQLDQAYAHVSEAGADDEEPGQESTARRDLARLVPHLDRPPGRLLDVGCWTGSLLSAATALGWDAEGIEPSAWAVERVTERGGRARRAVLGDDDLEAGAYQVVTCCDVLEHLVDPAAAAARIAALLEPGGLAFVTVPDAGSRVARLLGSRWWSVLPMHVQYFTRDSLRRLLEAAGLEVLDVRTHPKIFTRGYYADRLEAFAPRLGSLVTRIAARGDRGMRPIAPDFRDRLAVTARRPPSGGRTSSAGGGRA